ncbi:MAG TPA: TetR/AcrR family transcriptional regulator [Ktedonobacterales bacterium]|jgi:AcrR family transcriptional regulator|nr:TetR/AcrR family transcriptional regulator [Ktedonobacterales bacterium]
MAEVAQTLFDARQERILDAATALVLRLGYIHTSTGAIATRANVSKATLYNYWPGKMRLFHALVVRESLRVIDTWVARILADPQGGGIGPLCAHGFRALATSPLLQALYTSDIATLGELLRFRGPEVYSARYRENLAFVREMQRTRVIRTDLSAETVNHLIQALSHGVVSLGEMVDAADVPDLDAVAVTMAIALQDGLAPADPAPQDEAKHVIQHYFARLRELMVASLVTTQTRHDAEEAEHGNS